MPVNIKREEALVKYWVRCKANPSNPTNNSYPDAITDIDNEYIDRLKNKNFGAANKGKMLEHELGINLKATNPSSVNIAPWDLPEVTTDLELARVISKKEDNPKVSKAKTLEHIDNKYRDHIKIYTDGSKKDEKVGLGIFADSPHTFSKVKTNVTDNASILTAELTAIKIATIMVHSEQLTNQRVVILTDSLSAVKAIRTPNIKHSRPDISFNILKVCGIIKENLNTTIELCWIPAHCDIKGNEEADHLAKEGLECQNVSTVGLGKTEMYSLVRKAFKAKWQASWDEYSKGKLVNTILPNVGKIKLEFNRTNRKINNLRMGGAQLKIFKTPCSYCKEEVTIEHIFKGCLAYAPIRESIRRKCEVLGYPDTNAALLSLEAPKDIQTLVRKLLRAVKELF